MTRRQRTRFIPLAPGEGRVRAGGTAGRSAGRRHPAGALPLRLALLALLALLLAACNDGGNGGGTATGTAAPELTDVTVMLDWTPNTNHTGLYVARDRGWYREAGLNLTIVQPGATDAVQVVAAGEAEFGVSVQEAVIPARAESIPVVSIGAIVQHNTSSLMSLAADGIEAPGDLAGKTYGGFGGPLETALIHRLVECGGGNPDDVRLVEVGNVDYLVGMEQDRYDFVWVFEGWDVLRAREIEGKAVNTIPFAEHLECIPDWYTPLLITSEAMIREDPDVVRRFMAATARGYQFAIQNPAEAAKALLAAAPELDERLVTLSAEYLAPRYVEEGRRWGQQDLDVWTRFEAFLREAGMIEEPLDVGAAFTNDFLPPG